MKLSNQIINYNIRDIINYRDLLWPDSEDFLFLTSIPDKFEPFPVSATYYCFGMITEGSLEIELDGIPCNLSVNSLMTYRPGQTFKVVSLSEDTRGTFVLFTKKFLDYLNENIFSVQRHSFLSPGIPTVIELSTADRSTILKTFNEIFALLQHLSKPHWELIARNLTSALIYETDSILKAYIDPSYTLVNKDSELFISFNKLVKEHFKQDRSMDFYASKLCITANHLYLIIKRISGKSPSHFINQQLVNEAKHLICETAQNFSEIAYTLNFSDLFSFSKYFKKHTGYSPSQYRNEVLATYAD